MRIFLDFDGTIAIPDVTDLVLQTFAAPAWEAVEAEWIAGAISAAECMRRQIALIDSDLQSLNALLDQVELDADFPRFARWCDAQGVTLTIVSDGVDAFIRRVLERHGLGSIQIFANALSSNGASHSLNHPWLNSACAARQGVCKCAVTSASLEPLIFVGDGRSDECVSQIADVVFAKGKLAAFCAQSNRTFIPFSSFSDVQRGVRALLAHAPSRNAAVAD